ncbi:MAG: RsmB/NOP family class I SAM-dependent RNA methyltransferase [Thermovirgaceae bacterium]|nr:RsmB/NOP family class I SAM-dependent RNA methyltransferase [Thermovirgaceae bacterium]
MRGIEASLLVWRDVISGSFASEALRKRTDTLPESERTLASTLVFLALRRASLWKHIARTMTGRPIGTLSQAAGDALVLGIAGVTELRTFSPRVLVNAMVEWVKTKGMDRESGMVNAVLRKAVEEGPKVLESMKMSRSIKDLSLAFGVPGWAASFWAESWGKDRAKDLVRLASMKTFMSLRLSPWINPAESVSRLLGSGYRSWRSPLLDESLRMPSSAHPPSLPGFSEGAFTPQTESSMIVGKVASSLYKGGTILDMCSGRGIKACQILQSVPESSIEGWDLSAPRIRAAGQEARRLRVPFGRLSLRTGDALKMTPQGESGLVILDAPCSGSGTWARHPDAKWRKSPGNLVDQHQLQSRLLSRALEIVQPGGSVLYSTCSLFRQENEQVVAEVIEGRGDIVEMPPDNAYHCFIRGRPWGNYILPVLPWIDGFFITVLTKRV